MHSRALCLACLLGLAACGDAASSVDAASTGTDADVRADAAPSADAGACDPQAVPQPNVGLTEAAGQGGCPAGMVAVDTFCIDRYEAALVEAESGAPWSPFINPEDTQVRAVSLAGAIPQAYISGTQAAAACAAANKRLCTAAEWSRACQGASGDDYPYGATRVPGACNDERASLPQVDYFGADPSSWNLGHRCLDQLDDTVARTGSFEACVNAEGVSDLVGNLNEWLDDADGTTAGGTFVEAQLNGLGCQYRTTAHDRDSWDYGTGFRCCATR